MAEINESDKHVPDTWPYAFCSTCDHLSPVSGENSNWRVCLSCHEKVMVGVDDAVTGLINTIVFLDKTEAKLRNLPIIRDD